VRTIVVASDAPSVRADVVAVVGGPGTEIVEIDSGHDVAPAVAEHEPDLVIVDLQMGSMGGMAVCLELHLEESYGNLPHVPVLMLLDRRPDVFLAKRSGAEGWIVKPLDPIRLRKATTALTEGGTFHDESFQPVPDLSIVSGGHNGEDAGGVART
jgi:CheY-like chemotaxis protein